VALAAGVMVALVLVVGGASLACAARIYLNNDAVTQEYNFILRLDHVHSVFDDLIFELHQMDSTGGSDHAAEVLLMEKEIVRELRVVGETHRGHVSAADLEREQSILGDLGLLSEEGRAIALRLATGSEGLAESDFEWLNRATHEVPRLTDELAEFHRSRITGLLDSSRRMAQAIAALYAAFIVIGGALVTAAGLAANHGIASPLRRLAEAAQEISEGRLEARVRVRSADEIGRLSHIFNTMADRLQEHEGELHRAHDALQEKVRQTHALYSIGMEISRLQQLDRVLQSVVEKARELLRADAVVLCLFTPRGGGLVSRATSGAPEAFQPAANALCNPVPSGGATNRADPPDVIRPDFARGHLAAALRLGDEDMGAIHVTTREERDFTVDEADLLAGLATQAAIAIERVRLSEELRDLATVEERERLAREMHDGFAQTLGLLHLKLHGALDRFADAPAVADDLREMLRITDRAYEEVRQSMFGLRVFVSRGLGFVPALAEYLHEFSANNGIAVELETLGGPLVGISTASEIQAVRIIQEALTNVWKHAEASRALVRLEREGAWLRVTIEDHGVGWDRQVVQDRRHFGLETMRERAEGMGGRLEIETTPGRGTRVVATLPGGEA
jgi:nitrate/nitrite-specific signal transduction histidine kinase